MPRRKTARPPFIYTTPNLELSGRGDLSPGASAFFIVFSPYCNNRSLLFTLARPLALRPKLVGSIIPGEFAMADLYLIAFGALAAACSLLGLYGVAARPAPRS